MALDATRDRTRERILAAARRLTEAGSAPSISSVAREVGISRQGLYLHFPSRAALLSALVEHVDQAEDLATQVQTILAAPDGPAQVRAWAQMQARRNPRIALVARALEGSRHDDSEAAQAWHDRMANRMRGAATIEARLREEGRVHDDWSRSDAAALLWELLSFRVWDDLVTDAGLPSDRYVDVVMTTVLAALASPLRRAP
jgi:AcrR family transcriptional regulator